MSLRSLRSAGGAAFLAVLAMARPLAAGLGLSRAYWNYLGRLVRRTGLFDAAYYAAQAGGPDAAGTDWLRHFVQQGAAQGLRPSALFDTAYYRAQAGEARLARVPNPVLHYAFVGRHQGLSPSPYFDLRYYLEANPDVARSGMDPLLHFLRFGGSEGRNPSRQFDTGRYLNRHDGLHARRINPLVHYVTAGASAQLLQDAPGAEAAAAPVPPWQEWAGRLGPRTAGEPPLVDIIVPVYRDRELTLRCIYSVLSARVKTPYELVVIDDRGPEPELAQALQGLAEQGLFTLVTNPENRGYVYSANLGMQLHPQRDVVQLNSDAEVYNDWLDRLRAAAYRGGRVATVTPLSNNATICSYPGFNRDNHGPLELEDAELDRIAAEVNAGEAVDAPTGVGFCMYMRRDCIEAVGLYDSESFPRGYGEENDFCQRAQKQDWRNLIACDVFVRHHGSASFQGDRHPLIVNAMQKVQLLHPGYHKDVALFIRTDPLAQYRARLDQARLDRRVRASNVLLLNHDLGGGTERFVQEQVARLREAGRGVFIARPGGEDSLAIGTDRSGPMINLAPVRFADPAAFAERLASLGIDEVQLHHVLGLDIGVVEALARLAESGAVRLVVYVHDYLAICPRINLVDASGRYCGEPSPAACDQCLQANGSRYGAVTIGPWRARFARLLAAAAEVVVPDDDVATRLQRYFGGLRIEVRPHEPALPQRRTHRGAPADEQGPLKVAVVGAISPIKGLQVLLSCARDARERQLPLQFVVLGYTSNDEQAGQVGIEVTGRYREEDAQGLLERLGADAVLLPSVWPETYSYTLSVALRAGLPVFAFDIGAIASRLRAAGAAEGLIPLDAAQDPAQVNAFLLEKSRRACEQSVP
jgi:GT2 family glycosyltransferase/glycosyltransferase involved in cell wall biosynthesis